MNLKDKEIGNKIKDKEPKEKISAYNRINTCKKIDNKEEKIKCMYKILYDITEAQDITNLTIRKTIDDSEDPRWLPIQLTDNANAIILDASRYKGNPKPMIIYGYTEEKVDGLINIWNMIKSKYR